jgi:hypothetical protein
MGQAVTCEYADPSGTGDVEQQTTAGLAFWRKATNTPTFTDGGTHWALTAGGLVSWSGGSVDPPQACESVLGTAGFTYGGDRIEVPPIDGLSAAVCIASGPRERLPVTQAIGCLLVAEQPAAIGPGGPCGPFQTVQRDGASDLLWIAHDSAVSVFVTRLHWTGSGFAAGEPYLACATRPLEAIQDVAVCLAARPLT